MYTGVFPLFKTARHVGLGDLPQMVVTMLPYSRAASESGGVALIFPSDIHEIPPLTFADNMVTTPGISAANLLFY